MRTHVSVDICFFLPTHPPIFLSLLPSFFPGTEQEQNKNKNETTNTRNELMKENIKTKR